MIQKVDCVIRNSFLSLRAGSLFVRVSPELHGIQVAYFLRHVANMLRVLNFPIEMIFQSCEMLINSSIRAVRHIRIVEA